MSAIEFDGHNLRSHIPRMYVGSYEDENAVVCGPPEHYIDNVKLTKRQSFLFNVMTLSYREENSLAWKILKSSLNT
jgi:hypothetical protein